MIVTALIVAAVILAAHFYTHRRLAGTVDAHHARLEGQRDVQYKQAKQFQRELTTTIRATARVSDDCARTLNDTRQLLAVMEEFVKEVRSRG